MSGRCRHSGILWLDPSPWQPRENPSIDEDQVIVGKAGKVVRESGWCFFRLHALRAKADDWWWALGRRWMARRAKMCGNHIPAQLQQSLHHHRKQQSPPPSSERLEFRSQSLKRWCLLLWSMLEIRRLKLSLVWSNHKWTASWSTRAAACDQISLPALKHRGMREVKPTRVIISCVCEKARIIKNLPRIMFSVSFLLLNNS